MTDKEKIAALEASNLDLHQNAYGWMMAHDLLKAGKPYTYPSPIKPNEITDLRNRVKELEEEIEGYWQDQAGASI